MQNKWRRYILKAFSFAARWFQWNGLKCASAAMMMSTSSYLDTQAACSVISISSRYRYRAAWAFIWQHASSESVEHFSIPGKKTKELQTFINLLSFYYGSLLHIFKSNELYIHIEYQLMCNMKPGSKIYSFPFIVEYMNSKVFFKLLTEKLLFSVFLFSSLWSKTHQDASDQRVAELIWRLWFLCRCAYTNMNFFPKPSSFLHRYI